MLNSLDFKRKVRICMLAQTLWRNLLRRAKKRKQQIACRGLSGCVFLLFFFFFLTTPGSPVQDGRGNQRDRRPDDLSAQPRAAGLEATSTDCRHRRSAAHQPGPAAELVREFSPGALHRWLAIILQWLEEMLYENTSIDPESKDHTHYFTNHDSTVVGKKKKKRFWTPHTFVTYWMSLKGPVCKIWLNL